MIALGAALAYAGFTALCLAMARHHEQVFGTRAIPPRRRYLLVVLGWTLLGASLLPVVQATGWALGLVLWTGLLTAAAMSLSAVLTYAPQFVPVTACVLLSCGSALLLYGA